MKLFRTSPRQLFKSHFCNFLAEYCRAAGLDESRMQDIEEETKLFEPLTWLEAAVFFALVLVLEPSDSDDMKQWESLLLDRWMLCTWTVLQLSISHEWVFNSRVNRTVVAEYRTIRTCFPRYRRIRGWSTSESRRDRGHRRRGEARIERSSHGEARNDRSPPPRRGS